MDDESTKAEVATYHEHDDKSTKVACIMLATLSFELQKSFENLWLHDINEHLKEMFREKARQERFKTVNSLMALNIKMGILYVCTFRK